MQHVHMRMPLLLESRTMRDRDECKTRIIQNCRAFRNDLDAKIKQVHANYRGRIVQEPPTPDASELKH